MPPPIHTLKPFEIVKLSLERLADGSISIRAHNEVTGRVLIDQIYIVEGGLTRFRLIVAPAGITYELE